MEEDPEYQRDAWKKPPGHTQGFCPVNTQDWAAAKYELMWFSAWFPEVAVISMLEKVVET